MIHVNPEAIGKTTLAEMVGLHWQLAFGDRTTDFLKTDIFVGQREVRLDAFDTIRGISTWRIYCDGRVAYTGTAEQNLFHMSPGDYIVATIHWGGSRP